MSSVVCRSVPRHANITEFSEQGYLLYLGGMRPCLTCTCMVTWIASIIQGCNSDCVCIQWKMQGYVQSSDSNNKDNKQEKG